MQRLSQGHLCLTNNPVRCHHHFFSHQRTLRSHLRETHQLRATFFVLSHSQVQDCYPHPLLHSQLSTHPRAHLRQHLRLHSFQLRLLLDCHLFGDPKLPQSRKPFVLRQLHSHLVPKRLSYLHKLHPLQHSGSVGILHLLQVLLQQQGLSEGSVEPRLAENDEQEDDRLHTRSGQRGSQSLPDHHHGLHLLGRHPCACASGLPQHHVSLHHQQESTAEPLSQNRRFGLRVQLVYFVHLACYIDFASSYGRVDDSG